MSPPGAPLRDRVAAAVARFGRSDPKVLPLRLRLAEGLLALGQDDEAFAALDALVADCVADLGARHETTLAMSNNRAMKRAERALPEGLGELASLATTATETWGALDRRTLLVRSNLAAATGMAGNAAGAIAQIEALLAHAEAIDADVVDTLRTNLASWRERKGP